MRSRHMQPAAKLQFIHCVYFRIQKMDFLTKYTPSPFDKSRNGFAVGERERASL
jgi:hypothetical protein